MVISFDDFSKLKRKVEKARAERDKASGAKEELLRKLKEEFGADSLREGRKKLEELQDERQAVLKEYNREFRKFEQEFAEALHELEDDDE